MSFAQMYAVFIPKRKSPKIVENGVCIYLLATSISVGCFCMFASAVHYILYDLRRIIIIIIIESYACQKSYSIHLHALSRYVFAICFLDEHDGKVRQKENERVRKKREKSIHVYFDVALSSSNTVRYEKNLLAFTPFDSRT